MRRPYVGPSRPQRRAGWAPGLLLLPTAALILLALYTVASWSSSPDASSSHPAKLGSQGAAGAVQGGAAESLRNIPQLAASRHSSVKLETLPEEVLGTYQTLPGNPHPPLDPEKAAARMAPPDRPAPQAPARRGHSAANPDKPLVVYQLLEDSDPENEANFQYYLREGIGEDDGCTHIVLVAPSRDVKSLPRLPLKNARYVKRGSGAACMWGAWGELLTGPEVDTAQFTSFVLLSSRLRGPFLPAYAREFGVPWPSLLTSKLGEQTKLVGPLISCQDIDWPAGQGEQRPGQPYLSEHMLATDQVGLKLLQAAGVFTCHERTAVPDGDRFSAVMAARAALDAGHNLDCLLQRYQGVAWREKENWGCNAGLEADGGEHYYDGVSVHPMEVMFVEVRGMLLRKRLSGARTAKRYDRWKAWQAEMKLDLAWNTYAFDPLPFRAAGIAYMEKRGPGCFDFGHYTAANPELEGLSLDEKWTHFVQSGQFEDRAYRFNCVDVLARSFNCFDWEFYNRANEDLNQLRLEGRPLSAQQAWAHFLTHGFFEQRSYRFADVCGEDLDSPNNMGEGTR